MKTFKCKYTILDDNNKHKEVTEVIVENNKKKVREFISNNRTFVGKLYDIDIQEVENTKE